MKTGVGNAESSGLMGFPRSDPGTGKAEAGSRLRGVTGTRVAIECQLHGSEKILGGGWAERDKHRWRSTEWSKTTRRIEQVLRPAKATAAGRRRGLIPAEAERLGRGIEASGYGGEPGVSDWIDLHVRPARARRVRLDVVDARWVVQHHGQHCRFGPDRHGMSVRANDHEGGDSLRSVCSPHCWAHGGDAERREHDAEGHGPASLVAAIRRRDLLQWRPRQRRPRSSGRKQFAGRVVKRSVKWAEPSIARTRWRPR